MSTYESICYILLDLSFSNEYHKQASQSVIRKEH